MTSQSSHRRSHSAAFFIAIAAILSVAGCEKAVEVGRPQKYEKDGIGFSYSSNWTIIEDVEDDGYRYNYIESPGDSTLIFQVYANDEALELRKFAKWFSGEMRAALPLGEAGQSTFTDHKRTIGKRKVPGIIEEFPVSFLGEAVEQ